MAYYLVKYTTIHYWRATNSAVLLVSQLDVLANGFKYQLSNLAVLLTRRNVSCNQSNGALISQGSALRFQIKRRIGKTDKLFRRAVENYVFRKQH